MGGDCQTPPLQSLHVTGNAAVLKGVGTAISGLFGAALFDEIACQFDEKEQRVAAKATVAMTKQAAVGAVATWQSPTHEGVPGPTTVTAPFAFAARSHYRGSMDVSDLRIALFSGNYNMTVDGANKALNRLVGYLLRQGAHVRVYSPTVATPDFEPTGELVSVPSMAIPNRPEYRVPLRLSGRVREDMVAFAPNILHISSPDRVSRQAAAWARRRRLPVACSVHTRFETYFRYYNLSFMEPLVVAWLRKLYRKCDALIAPSESFAQVLREQRMNYDIGIWARGVERDIFHPGRRDMAWRREIAIGDDQPVIAFLGRLVMEKGLDVFADTIDQLNRRRVAHNVLVIGEGPAGDWFRSRLPDARFVGFQDGSDLARALASADILFNPSVTETFGNVTLEAMACGLPVVAARATGSASIVKHGTTGFLVEPGSITTFADRLQRYCADGALRAQHGAAALAESRQYEWDAINQVVADTYLRLIRQKQSRAVAVA